MAVCNVFTDLLLVVFPVPIIVTSSMTVKRKIQLVLLFSLSLSVVGVTLYRVPNIIREDGRQQYRSLLASVEILFATASANSLVLGSFMRDRGLKKQKFRRVSVAESFDPSLHPRRPTLHRHWGSDEDLVRDVGINVDPELRNEPDSPEEGSRQFTPAPVVRKLDQDLERWQFPHRQRSNAERSDDSLLAHDPLTQSRSDSLNNTPRRVSFFDVGGLLDPPRESNGSLRPGSYTSSNGDLGPSHVTPAPSVTASNGGLRRGSTALLQDLGGLLSPLNTRSSRARNRNSGTELQTIPQSQPDLRLNQHSKHEPELRDPGGLLS